MENQTPPSSPSARGPSDLTLLMDAITDYAILHLDEEAIIRTWNTGAERIFGFAKEEVLGRNGRMLFTPEDREKGEDEKEFHTAKESGRAIDERWHVRKGGERFWASGILYRLIEPGGKLRGYVKILRDVSREKQTATALLESERKLEFFVENLKDHALFMINQNGKIASWNKGAERLLCYTAEEALGRPFDILFTPEDAEAGEPGRQLKEALAAGKAGSERWQRRKDGTLFWASGVTLPLIDNEDQLRGFAHIMRDSTERKRAEEAHRMESIGRLAGGVAHDFNNMLTAINGYCELLLGVGGLQPPPREWVEEIQKAGIRAASLTRQLLAFSRRQMLTPKALQLNDVIHSTGPLLQRTLGDDIRVLTSLDPDLEKVLLDPAQFEQVILNLALNSREAMPRGGDILIETANTLLERNSLSDKVRLEPGAYVLLKFRDTGTGMDTATMARVFEPFFSTKSLGAGSTGLGLSTVYGVVRQSGGDIVVSSEPGKGTEFSIYLPVVNENVPPRPTGRKDPPPSRSERRILLVEDEHSVRKLTAQVLIMDGYQVLEAKDGADALAWLNTHPDPIHLVLSDVVMPNMGGPELAERVQELRPETPVLFMSGYTGEAVLPSGILESPAFIQKPFTVSALLEKVRETLGRPSHAA